MTCKIRHLKTALRNAGFIPRQGGKGSHTVWKHPQYKKNVVISGRDSNDAPIYMQKITFTAINTLNENDTQ